MVNLVTFWKRGQGSIFESNIKLMLNKCEGTEFQKTMLLDRKKCVGKNLCYLYFGNDS